MVHQHATPLEAQLAGTTLEGERVHFGGIHCGFKRRLLGFTSQGGHLGFSLWVMHSQHVLFEFVLPFELLPAVGAEEVLPICVPEHVHLQFVWTWEDLATDRTGELLTGVGLSYVLANVRVHLKVLRAVRAKVLSVLLVNRDVPPEELRPFVTDLAEGTLVELWYHVHLHVAAI